MRLLSLGLLALNALLALSWGTAPESVVLHPLAPPMTRIAALGDRPLDPEAAPPPPPAELLRRLTPLVAQGGDAEQRRLLERARAAEGRVAPLLPRSQSLRLAVEADAVALSEALGPARVTRFVADREPMSARLGETLVWTRLDAELSP
ncbi:MAG: hypothetical protein H6741_06135 [Alphaproteobacteria bacterium]|nr:hypothetical protein [Alphaproteobacteria bacterium]MCB9792288.1 hypothetical protein [Alphaproteobacteria bacterium]